MTHRLVNFVSLFDPRLKRDEDLSLLRFGSLESATYALKILWRWHERKQQSVRIWRLIWLVTAALAVLGWLI